MNHTIHIPLDIFIRLQTSHSAAFLGPLRKFVQQFVGKIASQCFRRQIVGRSLLRLRPIPSLNQQFLLAPGCCSALTYVLLI